MSDRDWHVHMARCFLAQAAHIRRYPQHSGWHATLLSWAASRRRRAAVKPEAQAQGALF